VVDLASAAAVGELAGFRGGGIGLGFGDIGGRWVEVGRVVAWASAETVGGAELVRLGLDSLILLALGADERENVPEAGRVGTLEPVD
jgi:hypothetical protein